MHLAECFHYLCFCTLCIFSVTDLTCINYMYCADPLPLGARTMTIT